MRKRTSLTIWLVRLFLISLALSTGACGRSTPTPTLTPAPTSADTPTPRPTRTPTVPPLASDENPLIFGIVSETNDPKATAAADEIIQQVVRITGYKIQSRSYPSTPAMLSDLQAGKVHIVFLPPFTYLWAKQKGWVQPALLTNHFGVYQIGTQILANVASKFTIFYDPGRGSNTMDPFTALKQLDGKRPCWLDTTSASGYVLPMGYLADKGVKVKEGVFMLNNTSIVRALYVSGICDFGVTFSTTGDPRSSTAVTQDLTDVMNRVVVIYQIDPLIPNLNISMLSSLSKEIRGDITFALQNIVRTENGKSAFTAAENYEIADLKPIDDTAYDPLRNVLKLSGVNLETLVGK